MSKDRATQLFMADTSVNEILDGMDIRFGTSPSPLVNGDSIAVQSAKGDFFHFLVQRPEGDFGTGCLTARLLQYYYLLICPGFQPAPSPQAVSSR